MARASALWVYKCNARIRSDTIASGDWDDFFAEFAQTRRPVEWGGSATMRSPASLQILWKRMRPGDLVLAWQTDRRAAVGLCRVSRLRDRAGDGEEREMLLSLVGEPFSPPVPLLDLRRRNPMLSRVRAFRKGQVQTLYETSADEARTLLRACGVTRTPLRLRTAEQRTVARGAGFGTVLENERVEAAAVAAFKRAYRAWRLDDVQDQGKGYDFGVRRGSVTRHIEIKGVRSRFPSFPITRGEAERAKVDSRWRLLVVTEALARPRIREWTAAQFRRDFELSTIAFMARLSESRSRGR